MEATLAANLVNYVKARYLFMEAALAADRESGDGIKGDFIRGFSDWPKTLVRESPFFHWLIGVV